MAAEQASPAHLFLIAGPNRAKQPSQGVPRSEDRGTEGMAAGRCRGLLPLVGAKARAPVPVQARSGHSSGGEPWEDSVEVDRDPSVLRRFGRVLREHKICKSAPEWLPFVPGSCYWVPPEELTVLPSEAFGFVRELSDKEIHDVVKRVRLAPASRPPPKEVVVIVEGNSGQDLLDDHLDDIVQSFRSKQGGRRS